MTTEEKITEFETELSLVKTSIDNIYRNGQSFRKGSSSGFSVDFAKLPVLLNRERELREKIGTLRRSL